MRDAFGKITAKDVTASKLFPSGAWECSAIVRGYWVHRTFYGYGKRKAVAMFVSFVNDDFYRGEA